VNLLPSVDVTFSDHFRSCRP